MAFRLPGPPAAAMTWGIVAQTVEGYPHCPAAEACLKWLARRIKGDGADFAGPVGRTDFGSIPQAEDIVTLEFLLSRSGRDGCR